MLTGNLVRPPRDVRYGFRYAAVAGGSGDGWEWHNTAVVDVVDVVVVVVAIVIVWTHDSVGVQQKFLISF